MVLTTKKRFSVQDAALTSALFHLSRCDGWFVEISRRQMKTSRRWRLWETCVRFHSFITQWLWLTHCVVCLHSGWLWLSFLAFTQNPAAETSESDSRQRPSSVKHELWWNAGTANLTVINTWAVGRTTLLSNYSESVWMSWYGLIMHNIVGWHLQLSALCFQYVDESTAVQMCVYI